MRKWSLLLIVVFLAQPMWAAPKRSCYWAKAISKSCDKAGPFPLTAEQIQKIYTPLSKTAILEELNTYEPTVKNTPLYSYRLSAPVDLVQVQKDRQTLSLYFQGATLMAVAKGISANSRIQQQYDIPATPVEELFAKARNGLRVTQQDVQRTLGTPRQTTYYFSPLYEGPVYQLSYGQDQVFVAGNEVLKIARNTGEEEAYLQLIKAYDPAAQEIVITQKDIQVTSTFPTISIWDKTAPALFKIFRNKTREYALYSIENVSDKDLIIRSKKGVEYALVEYKSGGEYRKFLFKGESPQTFVNVAANLEDILALNKKYGVSLTITRREFAQQYGSRLEQLELTREKDGATVTAYKTKDGFFIFENENLVETYENETLARAYLEKINLENQKIQLEKHNQQQQLLLQQQQAEILRQQQQQRRNVAYIYSETTADWNNRSWVIKSSLPKFETPKLDPNAELNPNAASF